jgi:hypothetical protein
VGACAPVAGAGSGGKGGIAWGGRNGARRQAIDNRGAEVYPSMVDAKQQGTQSFILVPAGGGRTSSSGVLKALYYLAPGVPVVGLLQARQERKPGFQVPGVMVEGVVGELEIKCVAQPVSCCVVSVSPRQGGSVPLL